MTVFKPMVLALAGVSVLALSTPADAQWRGRTAAAAGIGFAAGAVIGAAAANAATPRTHYYGTPYGYYGSPYASYGYYDPAPSYYESAPVYVAPSYGYQPYGYYRNPTRPDTHLSQTNDLTRP